MPKPRAALTYIRPVSGLKLGDCQFVPPPTFGVTSVPSGCGIFAGSGMGCPLASYPLSQLVFDELGRHQRLARGPVQQEVLSVARRLRDQLPLLPVDLVVYQHGGLGRIPVVRVVRRRLVVPHHLPGVGVQGDDRSGEQVVARTVLVGDHRLRVAGRDVDVVQLGVVGGRRPRHAAAVLHRFFARPRLRARIAHLLRHGVPAPLPLAALRMHATGM